MTANLRFSADEAAIFLNGTMGSALSAEDVAALEARAEGWIVGLHLAALSLRGRGDASAFIRAFSGDDGHVLDYIVGEVLGRQPPELQLFLLRRSFCRGPEALSAMLLRMRPSARSAWRR